MLRQPTRFQQRTMWNAITGVAIVVLGTLIVGLMWLIGTVFNFLQPILVPLAVAGIIAYLLDPVVRWLERRKLARLWAVITVYLAMLMLMGALVIVVIPGIQRARHGIGDAFSKKPAATQPAGKTADAQEEAEPNLSPQFTRSLQKLRARNRNNLIGWALTETDDAGTPLPIATPAPATPPAPTPAPAPNTPTAGQNAPAPSAATPEAPLPELDPARTRIGRILVDSKGSILEIARHWLSAGTNKILAFLGLVIGMLMVPVYLFFFLKDSAAIRDHWHDFVPLKASRFKTELVETLQEINGYLISFFRGQVLVALIDGILVGLALEFYRLPYGFVIGVFMAILGIIPYVGHIICLIPACIIAWLTAQGGGAPFHLSPGGYVLGVLIIFVTVNQINSLVTAPKIVGDSVGLHPMTVIFSMLFWSFVLGGFLGALLAVPMSASIKVLFRRYIWERQIKEPAFAADGPANESWSPEEDDPA